MDFLNPSQVRSWYETSINVSGFSRLNPLVLRIWKKAVMRGRQALPPGFTARMFENLTRRPAGERKRGRTFDREDAILDAICRKSGFEDLEGLFILRGNTLSSEFTESVMLQLLDVLPGFILNSIRFSSQDLESAFAPDTPADPRLPVSGLLLQIYGELENMFADSPFRLSNGSIFEITHPDLFSSPADRTFYRYMTETMEGISRWSKGTFTLREDAASLVESCGEPQVLMLGGYDSLSNKGEFSSLLTSELAYIDEAMEVDLFDYKYLEKQLMFFKREEGAVFRIKRNVTVIFELTPFVEHERHLGMCFGFSLALAEKILEAFFKDRVNIEFVFTGYKPSGMPKACEFFRHFLREKTLAEKVSVRLDHGDVAEPKHRTQCWLLGKRSMYPLKFVKLEFPQTDEFAALKSTDQERLMGNLILETIETMVKNAYS